MKTYSHLVTFVSPCPDDKFEYTMRTIKSDERIMTVTEWNEAVDSAHLTGRDDWFVMNVVTMRNV